jgi:acylphosphatase
VGNSGGGKPLERGIVVDIAIYDFPAVAVACVFAIADIGEDEQSGNFALDRTNRALNNAVLGGTTGSDFVLLIRNSEQDYAPDAERMDFAALVDNAIDGHLRVAGHGRYFAPHSFAFADKERKYELRRLEVGFANKIAHGLAGAQPAQTDFREWHTFFMVKQARRYIVRGRVQGVGYRYFVQKAASNVGVSGYARNLDDGTVEVYAAGTQDQLSALAGLLRQGPRFAEVRGVEETDAAVDGRTGFRIEG